MGGILDKLDEWLRGLLIEGITGNLSGMFDTVNTKVGEIAGEVGQTPLAWNSGVFSMIRNLSETVILPIAGVILTFVMCYELIQLVTEKNNMHDVDTWMFFKWIFKTFCAVLIVTNTWNIVMGIFDIGQSVVNQSAGVIIGNTSIDIGSVITDMEAQLEALGTGELFGLWFQSLFVGLTMNALSICIMLVIYGRMIEVYLTTSIGPIPLATMTNRDWSSTGQNYLKSLFALAFQAFLIMVCVGIYSVLVQGIATGGDLSGAIWACISNKIKGNAGEPMGQPPYGYIKDPDNPKRWIVDDEAAQVVRRIYSMTLDGLGTEQIAAQLERDGIFTPRAYWLQKGIKRPGKGKQQPPTKWNSSTVVKILSLQEYCGDILNFKTYSKSYKNKKRIENDRENWVVFKDVHEPIIDRAVWEQVQQKRGKIRKRRTSDGERNMFSGLLVCADCGSNLHFHFNQGNPDIKYFNCSNYKGNRGTCTSTHYVRVDFLEQVVLGEIRRLTKFASHYEDDFLKAVMGSSQESMALDRKMKEKELAALQARDEELDGLFERIYEDNVSGKLSDERFAKMSRRYETEQKELSEKIKALRSEMDKLSSKTMTTDMFISTVRKYTRARKLTPRMLNELIDRIEVHQAEKIDGKWVQKLTIYYNCVGAIFIPDIFPLPVPDVSVNTRKGVVVNYAPCQIAI